MFSGGQGIFLYQLSRELARRGHEITAVIGPPYTDDMPWADVRREVNHHFWGWHKDWLPVENPFVAFQPVNMLEILYRKLGFFSEPVAFSLRALRTMFGMMKNGKRFDIVHDVQSLGYGILPLRLTGLPVISTVHHPLSVDLKVSINQPDKGFIDVMGAVEFYPVLMQAFVARRMDMVLTSTEAGRRELIADFRVKPDRIRIVSNGLDTEAFYPRPGVERDPDSILFVGYTDNPQKGFLYLLRALKQMPERVRLVVVDDTDRWWAWIWIKELGLRDRVFFTGKLSGDELIEQYSKAAVTVMPSLYEGFGLPALEATLCGSGVVASKAGALPEIIEDGETGLLVPPQDPKALAEAVMRLLNNPGERRSMVEKGRRRIRENYSWEKVADMTERVYEEVLARKANQKHAHRRFQ